MLLNVFVRSLKHDKSSKLEKESKSFFLQYFGEKGHFAEHLPSILVKMFFGNQGSEK